MPAKDIYHDTVKRALEKDGWKITKENLHLRWGRRDAYVDIAAEKVFTAEKEGRKIAVEVKIFVGQSEMSELEKAVGQFILYRFALKKKEPDCELFLAIAKDIYNDLFVNPDGLAFVEINRLKMLVFDMDKLEKYQNVVESVLSEYAAIPYAYGEIERRTLFNREKDTYLLFVVGWDNSERVHGINIHVDIIGGKIWIQRDGTEDGIATDLESAGVPKSDIVLAFHAPELRKYTEYAVA